MHRWNTTRIQLEHLESRRLLAFSAELLANVSVSTNEVIVANDVAYFVAESVDSGSELWRTDGTRQGTRLVKDIRVGANSAAPQDLVAIDSHVVFSADDGIHGRELWITDGTTEETRMIADLFPGIIDSQPQHLTVAGNKLFFVARSSDNASGVWVFDGLHVSRLPAPSEVDRIWAMNDQAFFSGTDQPLWTSDGTLAGTFAISEPITIPAHEHILVGNERMFFPAYSPLVGTELWMSDGTAAGTQLVRDIAAGPDAGVVATLGLMDDVAYFWANDAHFGTELFRSDGTSDGTWMVKDIASGDASSFAGIVSSAPSIVTDDTLFFSANDGVHGNEVWVTNGTSDSTRLLQNLRPGTSSSAARFQFATNALVHISDRGRDWLSDGNANGTFRFESQVDSNFLSYGDFAIFNGQTPYDDAGLLITDGTSAGTVRLTDLDTEQANMLPFAELSNGSILYAANENELWLAENRTPSVVFAGPKTVSAGEAIEIDASASSDPQGQPLAFAWDVNNDGEFDDAIGERLQLTWKQLGDFGVARPGELVVSASVTDPDGNFATGTYHIQIVDTKPEIESVAIPSELTAGTFHAMSARAIRGTSSDRLHYAWDLGDGTVATGPDLRHRYATAGQYMVNLIVSTEDGAFNSVTRTINVHSRPMAADDLLLADEDSTILLSVLENDQANSPSGLIVSLATSHSMLGASIDVNLDGTIRYEPTASRILQTLSAGETRVDRFVYSVDNQHGGVDTAEVALTVTGRNDFPVADNDELVVQVDQSETDITDELLIGDYDMDSSDALRINAIDATDTLGDVRWENGRVFYSPGAAFASLKPGETASDILRYVVSDRFGATATARATIEIRRDVEPHLRSPVTLFYDREYGSIRIESERRFTSAIITSRSGIFTGHRASEYAETDHLISIRNDVATFSREFQWVAAEDLTEDFLLDDLQVHLLTEDGERIDDVQLIATSVLTAVYHPETGDLELFSLTTLTALEIKSASGLMTGSRPDILTGLFDVATPEKLFKIDSTGFAYPSSVHLGPILLPGLDLDLLRQDLQIEASGNVAFVPPGIITQPRDFTPDTALVPRPDDDVVTMSTAEIARDITNEILDGDVNDLDSDFLTIVSVDTTNTMGEISLENGRIVYSPGAAFRWLPSGQTVQDTFRYQVANYAAASDWAVVHVNLVGTGRSVPTIYYDASTGDVTLSSDVPLAALTLDSDFGLLRNLPSLDDGLHVASTPNRIMLVHPDGFTRVRYPNLLDNAWTDSVWGNDIQISAVDASGHLLPAFRLVVTNQAVSNVYDSVTGQVLVVASEPVMNWQWTSASERFQTTNANRPDFFANPNDVWSPNLISYHVSDAVDSIEFQLGQILPIGLSLSDVRNDVTVTARLPSGEEVPTIAWEGVHYVPMKQNSPPVAVFDSVASIAEGGILALDASRSFDTDSNLIRSFAWDVNSDGDFTDAEGASPTFSWSELAELGWRNDGEYRVSVKVTDELGVMHVAYQDVVVTNAPPIIRALEVSEVGFVGRPVSFPSDVYDPADALSETWEFGDGSIHIGSNPTHTYAEPGRYTVTLTVRDQDGSLAMQSSHIEIVPLIPPVANDDTNLQTTEDDFISIDVLANDIQFHPGELTVLNYDTVSLQDAVIRQGSNNELIYSPATSDMLQAMPQGFTMFDSFSYIVTDANGQFDSATVRIQVTGTNDSPIGSDDALQLREGDGPLDITEFLLANDTDWDRDETSRLEIVAVESSQTTGTVQLTDGRITFSAETAFANLRLGEIAEDVFSYSIQDPQQTAATGTVRILIYGQSDRRGDLDGDGAINAVDIDLLRLAISQPFQSHFDLDDNSLLNDDDADTLIENILGTSYGDANLDGIFNSADLVHVFQAGQYEDTIARNSGWSTGDWNGDGEFNSQDFVHAFQRSDYAFDAISQRNSASGGDWSRIPTSYACRPARFDRPARMA